MAHPVGTRGGGYVPEDSALYASATRLISYRVTVHDGICAVVMGGKLRHALRVVRLAARHDRRALKNEAERTADSLARWAHASESWMHGEIAEARRSAEVALQTSPDDFDLIRICLDYHIRARDSVQMYAYAAKNPAPTLRRLYAVMSLVLWPLWLLGSKRGRGAKLADNCDKWVAWSRNYVAKHFDQFAATLCGDGIPIERSAIAVTARTLRRRAWMMTSIEVSIRGKEILTTAGINGAGGSLKQLFVYGGRSHDAVLIWRARSVRSIPYTLEIDGCTVEISRAQISHWWARYWPFAATIALAVIWHFLTASA